MLAQKLPVGFETRLQDLCLIRDVTLHLGHQRIADVRVECSGISVTGSGARHRDARAGAGVQPQCIGRAGKFQINQMEAIRNHKPDRP